jgi:hypothetical protein
MPLNVAGRGSSANPCGGAKLWPGFRIFCESAGLFHGQVIDAGLLCPRIRRLAVMLSEAKHLWRLID